jgi:hypothetical protein
LGTHAVLGRERHAHLGVWTGGVAGAPSPKRCWSWWVA